jgi:hypothetical protein
MFIEGLLLILLMVVLLVFAPVPVQKHSVSVFSGSCARGFTERQSIFKPANLFLTKFDGISTLPNTDTDKPVILFIPHIYSSTYNATPRLEALAAKGYTVISAEFFTDDLKYFNNILDARVFRTFALQMRKPFGDYNKKRELEKKAALALVTILYGKTIFYDPTIKEPTPLMDDIYLTQPLEAWLMDKQNYQQVVKEAKLVPQRFAAAMQE